MFNWIIFLKRECMLDTISIIADSACFEGSNYIFTRSDEDVALIPYDNVIAISRIDSIDNGE